MRQPLVAGNWKMHGTTARVSALLEAIITGKQQVSAAELAVLVPYPYITITAKILTNSGIAYGAQDLSANADGAFTGDVSSSMLLDLQCNYVIVGHSERRVHHNESNQAVCDKFTAAAHAGLRPILCVGELLEQRESCSTEQVLAEQLQPVLNLTKKDWQHAVVAYEPVWAIGTGLTATPEQAQQAHAFIRQLITEKYGSELANQLRILYGGSVKPSNAAELFAMPDIDGGLIGGASLDAESFLQIGEACKM